MPPLASAFARHAKRRTSLAKIRARAPKHPIGPEQQIRAALTRIFRAYHKRLRALVLAHARTRLDAEEHKGRRHEFLVSVAGQLASYAHELLYRSSFRRLLDAAAQRTADSVKKQTASALQVARDFDPDLSRPAADLSARVFGQVTTLVDDSNERAADIFDEWDDLDPDTSPRAGDTSALGGMLDDGLDGITGTALAWAGLAFGDAFADMVKGAQQDAGVSSYMWLSQRDSKVRPAHLALDGEVCSWDEPPLSADDSDSGGECHAGEDLNCRCVASPIDEDDGLTDRQSERLPN